MTTANMTGLDALRVLQALDSEGWKLTRHPPDDCLTDEANIRHAWSVERTEAPYCPDRPLEPIRIWTGPTPLAALENAKRVMDPEIERYKKRYPS